MANEAAVMDRPVLRRPDEVVTDQQLWALIDAQKKKR